MIHIDIVHFQGPCSILYPVLGTKYTDILNSRFCSGKLLLIRNVLRDAVRTQFAFMLSFFNDDQQEIKASCTSCRYFTVQFHFSESLLDVMV
jgi:hypothetical protein